MQIYRRRTDPFFFFQGLRPLDLDHLHNFILGAGLVSISAGFFLFWRREVGDVRGLPALAAT
jgi:hypothetical protein